MTPSAACIFCRIVAGEAEATFVYRAPDVVAFMDLQPVTPGHVLVIPAAHASSIGEVDAPTLGRVMQVAQEVAAAIRSSGLRCEGVNLFVADGEAAGQEVFHAHLHVIPRFEGDGFGLRLPPDYPQVAARATLDAVAAQIRAPAADRASAGIVGVDHVQLAMPSGREVDARAFYAGVLGLREVAKPPALAGRGGVWFEGGRARIHLGAEDGFRPARKAHPALLVDGLGAIADRCRGAGYEVTPDDALPGYERVYVADPFGNRIELLEPATGSVDGMTTL